ncbi:MAG: ribosome silencing factor [Deltaproteobacteria bacterium]|nr:MAG: ribosome silencing factor [Deltaproteobacteria bacterium]
MCTYALEKKAENVKLLDIREITNISDYFFVCSGTSDRHVITIADYILEKLGELKIKPHAVEGLSEGRWVILDFIDVMVHIFQQPVRDFYEFDDLWSLGIEVTVSGK